MALRNVVLEGEDILRKKCREVTDFSEKITTLLDDMAETMYHNNGVGLAAPQVGILKRMFVIDVGEGLIEVINPKIICEEGSQEDIEGCLSCPGEHGLVVRPMNVTVVGKNRHGNDISVQGEGLFARALCHETDHLNGIIFKDKAERMLTSDEL